MSRHGTWKITLAGLLVLGWTAIATAQPPGRPGGPWGGDMGGPLMLPMPLLMRSVGLSEAQQGQVRQIVANHRQQFQALRTRLRDGHEQLAAKLSAPAAVTAEDAAPLMNQISQLRDLLAREALQVALEIRAVLTPEQLAKAAQVRARMQDLRSEMRSLMGDEP